MPKRIDGPRRRGANAEWEELVEDDGFTLFLLGGECYELTPFKDRADLMESYPNWREEYLEFCQRQHEAREPQPPNHPDPLAQEHLERSYQLQHRTWVSQGYETPRLERWYQGFE